MHEIYDAERVRRVLIFQRDDGKWSFAEAHFSAHPLEMRWVSQAHGVSICDTRETALREARSRVDWLLAETPQSSNCPDL